MKMLRFETWIENVEKCLKVKASTNKNGQILTNELTNFLFTFNDWVKSHCIVWKLTDESYSYWMLNAFRLDLNAKSHRKADRT